MRWGEWSSSESDKSENKGSKCGGVQRCRVCAQLNREREKERERERQREGERERAVRPACVHHDSSALCMCCWCALQVSGHFFCVGALTVFRSARAAHTPLPPPTCVTDHGVSVRDKKFCFEIKQMHSVNH